MAVLRHNDNPDGRMSLREQFREFRRRALIAAIAVANRASRTNGSTSPTTKPPPSDSIRRANAQERRLGLVLGLSGPLA